MPGVLGRPAAALATAKRILQLGAAVGAVNCLATAVVAARAGGLFTTSAEVLVAMDSILPVMCATLVLHNVSMASEGLMLASRELPFLLVTYAIGSSLAVATLGLAVNAGWGLPGVWLAVLQFQACMSPSLFLVSRLSLPPALLVVWRRDLSKVHRPEPRQHLCHTRPCR